MDPSASYDPTHFATGTSGWSTIQVPHTWQTLGHSPDYVGVAWYRLSFFAPTDWQQEFVRFEFEAISHTAHVFLNGQKIGEHIGKGYTAFTCDASPALAYSRNNTLLVRVENTYSEAMLPRAQSYDWTNDGGIIRPVRLLVTPPIFIERIEIDAIPDFIQNNASLKFRALVRNTTNHPQSVQMSAYVCRSETAIPSTSVSPLSKSIPANSSLMVALSPATIDAPALWHFDAPNLYAAEISLGTPNHRHTCIDTFGIRRFEVRGTQFFLNNEPVFLIGLERMAGSHPIFGMAEPSSWIESNHADMKDLNCVYTRVHWAQDRRVLDYCDRYGILMQEEVPAWGPKTFANTSDQEQHALEQNGLEQLREMVTRDRNHPCIVSWGLCNEVDGKNPRSRQFAHAIAKEARALDPLRLQTYASHTLNKDPAADMAGDFDFISTNEYYGSWAPGGEQEVREHLERIIKAFPNKPIVVSEYGWCECQPNMPPGDHNRVDIVNNHTQVFREFPSIAGAIYFDYNDYRTLVGDKGIGALKQRVHGVVDLFANRKPSFNALIRQSSPIEHLVLEPVVGGFEVEMTTRSTLPAYTLKDYQMQWIVYGYDDLPMEGGRLHLATAKAGSSQKLHIPIQTKSEGRIVVQVLRPTGFAAATTERPLRKS